MSSDEPSLSVGSFLKGLLLVVLDLVVGACGAALIFFVGLGLFGWVHINYFGREFFGLDPAWMPGWLVQVINAGAIMGVVMGGLALVAGMCAAAMNWRAPILWLQAVSRRRLERLDREKKAEAARQRLAERGAYKDAARNKI